jgi:hypothetical protein
VGKFDKFIYKAWFDGENDHTISEIKFMIFIHEEEKTTGELR